jgi:RimJ/RimL family protein N-acetyltransferase
MNHNRGYPETVSEGFDPPPLNFVDGEERSIQIRSYAETSTEFEAIVNMYDQFDPADRAQGIPPSQEDRIRDWLANILDGNCLNVVAWHNDTVAGHATLVPDEEAFELAIFVLQAFQQAGIGTQLVNALLGYGAAQDVSKVWLTVERWNHAAVALYEKVGFEMCETESFEIEMSIRLAADE